MMSSSCIFVFLSSVPYLYLLWIFSLCINGQTDELYSECIGNKTYTANSTFQENLKKLLSVLSSKAGSETYYAFPPSRDTDYVVYGFFQCRDDVSADACKSCVALAATHILKLCPNQTQVVVWYDYCLLRYADLPSYTSLEVSIVMYNTQNVADLRRFDQVKGELLNRIITQAANGKYGEKYFAKDDTNFTALDRLYGLAQCTPYVTSVKCQHCLTQAVEYLNFWRNGSRGARAIRWNCNIRYELYPFYLIDVTPPTPSPSPSLSPSQPQIRGGKMSVKVKVAVIALAVSLVLLFMLCYCFITRKAIHKDKNNSISENTDQSELAAVESLHYDLKTIRAATNNFSNDNELGEGGFGKVYKGILINGQEIAVKRLSKFSGQGIKEFKNEVVLVAKLQHRNLVRLLGFCLEGKETLLIYEFLPNKSLDYFLFDSQKQNLLNWSTRYKIIRGIARAILYLHEDSRHKVIHRDLKTSNILLDENLNPKLSDFGMARIVGVDQSQVKTNRIVGTYGYMSPEYAMFGEFSPKSDMYSFGILILEIISGKRNSTFYHLENVDNLPGHVFRRWIDGEALKLVDPSFGSTYNKNEIMKCIHIGLLCVQEKMEDRPTMAAVVNIFNNTNSNSVELPIPNQPAFFTRSRMIPNMAMQQQLSDTSASTSSIPLSINETSMTNVYPR